MIKLNKYIILKKTKKLWIIFNNYKKELWRKKSKYNKKSYKS